MPENIYTGPLASLAGITTAQTRQKCGYTWPSLASLDWIFTCRVFFYKSCSTLVWPEGDSTPESAFFGFAAVFLWISSDAWLIWAQVRLCKRVLEHMCMCACLFVYACMREHAREHKQGRQQ